jgi:hypothetical protein
MTNEDLLESAITVHPDLVDILRKEIAHTEYTRGLHERDVKALEIMESQRKLIDKLSAELDRVNRLWNQHLQEERT